MPNLTLNEIPLLRSGKMLLEASFFMPAHNELFELRKKILIVGGWNISRP